MRIRFITYCNAVTKPFNETVVDTNGRQAFEVACEHLESIQEGLGRKYELAYRAYQQDRKQSVQLLYHDGNLIMHVVVLYETYECIDRETELSYNKGYRDATVVKNEEIKLLRRKCSGYVKEVKLAAGIKYTQLKEKYDDLKGKRA